MAAKEAFLLHVFSVMESRDMRKNILLMTAAAVLGFGSIVTSASTPAQAQVGLEVGPGGVRVYEDRDRGYRPVVERRRVERRVIVDDDDRDCRVEVRRHINRYGERVTRRMTICD
jgi:hypothetical protein